MSKIKFEAKGIKPLIYGTAWKKELTADLVELAIDNGFRAIDTACQPKHYQEHLVGEGIKRALKKGIKREEIFIQTKFTSIGGQDPDSIPYDPVAPLETQVRQSLETSKYNLGMNYIDSLIMHSPMESWERTIEVWRLFEEFVENGDVGQIGISNCYQPEVFEGLFYDARIRPAFLQNRFYADTNYDQKLRTFCREHHVTYQSFWTLTANPPLLESETVASLSQKVGKTPAQILFRYLIQNGVIPLTGTTSEKHMKEDLDIFSFELTEAELNSITELLH